MYSRRRDAGSVSKNAFGVRSSVATSSLGMAEPGARVGRVAFAFFLPLNLARAYVKAKRSAGFLKNRHFAHSFSHIVVNPLAFN